MTNIAIDNLPDGTQRTHFNVAMLDDVIVTVTVIGSRAADGSDRSSASATMGLSFPSAAAGLRFKEAVQLADMDDLKMLRWPISKLPTTAPGTVLFSTDLLS